MPTTAVIYQPRLDTPLRFGKQVFPYQIDRTPVAPAPTKEGEARPVQKTKNAAVEISTVVLEEGANFIDSAIYEAIIAHSGNKTEIERMEATGAMKVYASDSKTPAGDSTDWTNVHVAAIICAYVTDRVWLETSRNRDKRLEVGRAIAERMEELKSEQTPNQMMALGQFV